MYSYQAEYMSICKIIDINIVMNGKKGKRENICLVGSVIDFHFEMNKTAPTVSLGIGHRDPRWQHAHTPVSVQSTMYV